MTVAAVYQRIAARRGNQVAAVAVARKLAVIVWHMLTSCLVAEHCWDPVKLAIIDYAYRFERLQNAVSGRR